MLEELQSYYKGKEGENLSCCRTDLTLSALKRGEVILDIGCGAGEDLLRAAELVGEEGEVIGLDILPEMIAAAQEKVKARGLKNVRLLLAPMEEIPLPAGKVDVVISNCTINHSPDKERVFREIFRVLKPGGRLVINDAVSLVPLPEEIRQNPAARARCFGGAQRPEEYRQMMAAAGFTGIKIIENRRYIKEGFPFASCTFTAVKEVEK